MRTALALVVTATVAALLVTADRAFAQQPGQLRVTMQLADSRSGITYPTVKKALIITGEAGGPVYRLETGPDGTIEIFLPPGLYVVESANPVPFQGRSYRWSTTVTVDSGIVFALVLNEQNGQSAPIASSERGPFVALFLQYGAPQRLTGGLSVLFPVGRTVKEEGILGARGIELQAGGGQGGWRVAAGAGAAALPFWWADVLLTATRTTADPRGAFPESTYVGVEAGGALILPLDAWVHLPFGVMFKPSVGFARRLDGSAGLKRRCSPGAPVHTFSCSHTEAMRPGYNLRREGRMATFRTSVVKAEGMNATGLPVPAVVVEKLGAGKRPKVTVTLKGYTYRSTVAVYGSEFFLPLAAVHRQAAGVKAGQPVQVTVELDTAPREVEVPKDLAAALKKAGVRAAFDALAFTHRKEHVRAIDEAKAPETRARRIEKAVAIVAGGPRR